MLTDLDAFEVDPTDSPASRRVTAAIKAAPKRGTMDFQAGKQDGILRKGSVNGQMNAMVGTTPLHIALTLTFAFTDVNQPVTVRAPKGALSPSRIRRLSRAKLGSLANDVFGARTGKRRRGGRSYVTCVGAAKDLIALERCQKLLP
jgi:hypothetical protein